MTNTSSGGSANLLHEVENSKTYLEIRESRVLPMVPTIIAATQRFRGHIDPEAAAAVMICLFGIPDQTCMGDGLKALAFADLEGFVAALIRETDASVNAIWDALNEHVNSLLKWIRESIWNPAIAGLNAAISPDSAAWEQFDGSVRRLALSILDAELQRKRSPALEPVTIQHRNGSELRSEAIVSGHSFLFLNPKPLVEAGDLIIRACSDGLSRGFVVESLDKNEALGPVAAHCIASTRLAPPMDSFEDAGFWRERADQLKSLNQRQNTESAGNKESADWMVGLVIYAGPDDQLGRSEARGGLDSAFRNRFDEVAGRSAIALGCPTGVAPVAFWLHCLWQDLMTNHPEMADRDLCQSSTTGGIVHDLLSSSEAYCLRLALMMAAKQSATRPERQVTPRSEATNGSGATSKIDDATYCEPVNFQYRYADDFPGESQRQIESMRQEANRRLRAKPINSFDDLVEAKREWLLELASGAAEVIGSVAATEIWGANRAREMLRDYALKAAYAARMTVPAVERFFESIEWKSLDDALFQPPDTGAERTQQSVEKTASTSPKSAAHDIAEERPTPVESDAGKESDKHNVPERRSPKDIVFAAKLKKQIRSSERFAARIGISKDTLIAITEEKRWVSDETYATVAAACECKPADLHPRDLPMPERRRG
jgi:hypothetical protein